MPATKNLQRNQGQHTGSTPTPHTHTHKQRAHTQVLLLRNHTGAIALLRCRASCTHSNCCHAAPQLCRKRAAACHQLQTHLQPQKCLRSLQQAPSSQHSGSAADAAAATSVACAAAHAAASTTAACQPAAAQRPPLAAVPPGAAPALLHPHVAVAELQLHPVCWWALHRAMAAVAACAGVGGAEWRPAPAG